MHTREHTHVVTREHLRSHTNSLFCLFVRFGLLFFGFHLVFFLLFALLVLDSFVLLVLLRLLCIDFLVNIPYLYTYVVYQLALCPHTHAHGSVHAHTREHLRIHAVTREHLWTHVDTHGHTRKQTDTYTTTYEHTRSHANIHTNTYGHTRTHALTRFVLFVLFSFTCIVLFYFVNIQCM